MTDNTNTIEKDHRDVVLKLLKPGDTVKAELTPTEADIWHAATGVATEAGEMMTAVFPILATRSWDDGLPGQPWSDTPNYPGLDMENMIEEVGDHLFYNQALRSSVSTDGCCTGELGDSFPAPYRLQELRYHPSQHKRRLMVNLIFAHAIVAAEILDVAKRVVIYRKDLDAPGKKEGDPTLRERLANQLRDDEWILAQLARLLDITLDTARVANIEKLTKGRYKDGYSDDAANARADKEEGGSE